MDSVNVILIYLNFGSWINHASLSLPSRRDPKSLVKPKKRSEIPEASNPEYADEIKKLTPKASRHLYLIRHGQYNMKADDDTGRDLTKLGMVLIFFGVFTTFNDAWMKSFVGFADLFTVTLWA